MTPRGAVRVARRVARLLAAGLLASCARADASAPVEIRFWALGREGEVVQPLVREFERRTPGVRVRVQQLPFSAAHEKLLTAVVGGATPDLAQLGNTWVPELAALRALEPLDGRVAGSAGVAPADYFPGAWAANVVDDTLYGVPWYVDTRLVFYRRDLLARAGVPRFPETWDAWTDAMRRVRRVQPPGGAPALLPVNEFEAPVIAMLQSGAPLLRDGDTRGNFRDPRVRRAFAWYVNLYRAGHASAVANTQIASVYQELAEGRHAMYVSGPWNVAEFRKRLPDSLRGRWGTAPWPGPNGAASGTSLPGGSSLVLFRGRGHDDPRRRAYAWQLVEHLSTREAQVAFARLSGDLPARASAWPAAGLAADSAFAPFLTQLQRLTPVPRIPEWELVATRVAQAAERAARGAETVDQALARLDGEVDAVLEKRRWLRSRGR